MIIFHPLINSGLLEDDLGKPYFIGVARVSPWEIPCVFFIPGDNGSCKIHDSGAKMNNPSKITAK
jgi:hypothetical protein